MIDGGFSQARALTQTTPHLTISDRLDRLRQLRKAWKTLSWTRCLAVPMPGTWGTYELVGGVFYKTQPTVWRGWGWELGGWPFFANGGDGNEHEGLDESRTMSATWLPGKYDHQGRTVVRDDLGIRTRDFAMDPSQDLMVLLKGVDSGLYVAPFSFLSWWQCRSTMTMTAMTGRRRCLSCSNCTFGQSRRISHIQTRGLPCCACPCGTLSRMCPSKSSTTLWGCRTASTPFAWRYGIGRPDS